MRINLNNNNDISFFTSLPALPGVYKYYDNHDKLLYVGKAVNLYNRIKSYFINSNNLSPRVKLFVQQISYIELTITKDESSALVLEKQLILELQPRYNILLKHDTTTAGVLLSYHPFPRCSYYRANKLDIKNADYFPMPNSYTAYLLITIIQKLYKIRNCTDSVFKQGKTCLLYQIGRCSAPCVDKINNKAYAIQVAQVKKLLLGNKEHATKELRTLMAVAAKNLEFERATLYRDQLLLLTNENNSALNNLGDLTADILLYGKYQNCHYYYLISLVTGKYTHDSSFEFNSELNDENLHKVFLEEYYCNYLKVNNNSKTSKIEIYFTQINMLDEKTLKYFANEQQIFIINPNSCDKILSLVAMGMQNLNLIMESKG